MFPAILLAGAGLLMERRIAVVLWLAAAIIGVKSTGLDYGHYYTLAVPPLLRKISNIMKSPTALGTRNPEATV